MSDLSQRFAQLSQDELREIDQVCAKFERDLPNAHPSLESHLQTVPDNLQSLLFGELLAIELEALIDQGAVPEPAGYEQRFPDRTADIDAIFKRVFADAKSVSEAITVAPQSDSAAQEADVSIKQIGRFRIDCLLGQGGFGLVYKAHDDRLDRVVAVKVPRAELISGTKIKDLFLEEAKILAGLDHPYILPVYEVGSDEQFPFFIVSKFIFGKNLNEFNKANSTFDPIKQAGLIASLAEALQHAHEQGLVHRDVKPANIMLDAQEHAYLADFGLALRDRDFGKGGEFLGTPAYMSPEQARGESHRVDGRSDIFSLGIVFYELLCGRRPFMGSDVHEIRQNLIECRPRPPRQYRSQIPKELERICLRSLSKRMSERYLTAHDMAADLRGYLLSVTPGTPQNFKDSNPAMALSAITDPIPSALNSNSQSLSVIPKGLRSFDKHDKDFFLQLLPGARDKNGLPESIRFWKTRIEATSTEDAFSVGLIYGPSGCGKSSLMKAGLLPVLASNISTIYVEASGSGLETKILERLRRRCPTLSNELDLADAIAELRTGESSQNQKVLIVIDQFEQWLNVNQDYANHPLVQSLRQCDGQHVQCLVMVRDEFWLASSRLMRELDINLVPGENVALVDLFDRDHAIQILKLFGRAFEKLPSSRNDLSPSQVQFLVQAIDGLARDNTIVCVRLALFAEMFRNRPWTSESLQAVGGIAGVGEAFLHEMFESRNANPEHRYHREAAQRVLKALLPKSGIDIKGRMKSSNELLEVSGYQNQPAQFENLMRLLDSDLRLVTPTEMSVGEVSVPDAESPIQSAHYQLSHDYLVHVLQKWLNRKQRETRRGRAELKLDELTDLWIETMQNRYLPTTFEWLRIEALTERKKWTPPQSQMMHKATRMHMGRLGILAVAVLGLIIGLVSVRSINERNLRKAEAARIIDGLVAADISQVQRILAEDLPKYQAEAGDYLKQAYENAEVGSNAQLNTALALYPDDDSVMPVLSEQLLNAKAGKFIDVRDLTSVAKQELLEAYWQVALNGEESAPRFNAVCALACFDPTNVNWQDKDFCNWITRRLVQSRPSEFPIWCDAVQPIHAELVEPLSQIFRDKTLDAQTRGFATDALARYLAESPGELFSLLIDADQKQFPIIFDLIKSFPNDAIGLGVQELSKVGLKDDDEQSQDTLAKQKANTLVMISRLGAMDSIWAELKHSENPTAANYFIQFASPFGCQPGPFIERLGVETDISIQRSLVRILGQFPIENGVKQGLVKSLLDMYQNATDHGLHATAEWLLRKWNEDEAMAELDKQLQQTDTEIFASGVNQKNWYINTQGISFAVLEAGVVELGHPQWEEDPGFRNPLYSCRIDRKFAIASKEITRGQYRVFFESGLQPPLEVGPDEKGLTMYGTDENLPMTGVTWFEAARYCNWLSEQEGIEKSQWCYEVNETGEYGPGMKAKENFTELKGYRLPTGAEWEFACRAGTTTPRYFGFGDQMLPAYAWYSTNSGDRMHPVGELMPNAYGLFDMHGNIYEHCYEVLFELEGMTEIVVDSHDVSEVQLSERRLVVGGSCYHKPSFILSAGFSGDKPDVRRQFKGFRPVRTMEVISTESE